MKYLFLKNNFLKNKKQNKTHNSNFFLYNIEFICWNYSVDTWKLLNIERVLIDLKDIVFKNSFQKTKKKNIYLNNFLSYIKCYYLLFFISKTTPSSLNYLYFFQKNVLKNNIISYKKLLNFYAINLNSEITNIYILNLIWINYFFSKIYLFCFKKIKNNSVYLFLKKNRLFFKQPNDVFFYKYINKINFNTINLSKNHLFISKYNFFFNKKNILNTSYLLKTKTLNNSFLNLFFVNKPVVFNNSGIIQTNSFLRKQKIYTKNKYSRSRQYCKNIVLFGLLLNIILMFGLNSAYYAILINVSYIITIFYFILFITSLYFIYKYKLLNIYNY